MVSSRQPIIAVRDLRVHFETREGNVRAVDGVSFDVGAGEIVGLVGESGCGKSITAKSILRVLEPPGRIIGGRILYFPGAEPAPDAASGSEATEPLDLAALDADGAKMRAIRGGEIALIFQEPMSSFSPVHTIGSQMMEMTQFHWGYSRARARQHAIDMLRRVGVSRPDARVDEYAHQLSGGMRQRAMIALALSCKPRLLIADEPTTSLDVTTQAQVLDLLRRLQADNGMSVLLITHNLGVVAEMCDSVVVMYLGRVVERGPVDAIFHSPQHPYTRALLQSMPNLALPPRVRLPAISGSIPHPYDRPGGCSFHPRCPSVMSGQCDRLDPALVQVGVDHASACLMHGSPDAVDAPPAVRR